MYPVLAQIRGTIEEYGCWYLEIIDQAPNLAIKTSGARERDLGRPPLDRVRHVAEHPHPRYISSEVPGQHGHGRTVNRKSLNTWRLTFFGRQRDT
jgi:hypothetical protein